MIVLQSKAPSHSASGLQNDRTNEVGSFDLTIVDDSLTLKAFFDINLTRLCKSSVHNPPEPAILGELDSNFLQNLEGKFTFLTPPPSNSNSSNLVFEPNNLHE